MGVPGRTRGRVPWHCNPEPCYASDVRSGPASWVCGAVAARSPARRFAQAWGAGQDHGVCRNCPWRAHARCGIWRHAARRPRPGADGVQDDPCRDAKGISAPEGLPTDAQPLLSSARQCSPRWSGGGERRRSGAGGGPRAAPCCRRLCSGAGRCARLGCKDDWASARTASTSARRTLHELLTRYGVRGVLWAGGTDKMRGRGWDNSTMYPLIGSIGRVEAVYRSGAAILLRFSTSAQSRGECGAACACPHSDAWRSHLLARSANACGSLLDDTAHPSRTTALFSGLSASCRPASRASASGRCHDAA